MIRARPAGPALAARHAILDLYAENAWALDAHDLPRYLAAFAPHAVFAETLGDGTEHEFAGAGAIEPETARRFAGPTGHQHRMSNHAFAPLPDGRDGWLVWSYWSTTTRDPASGEVALVGTGWLRDEIEFVAGAPVIVHRRVGPWGVPTVGHPFGR
jgi:hypothetical protein